MAASLGPTSSGCAISYELQDNLRATSVQRESDSAILIPLSKRKIILCFLGSLAFVAGSVWMWSIADVQQHRSPLYAKGVALFAGGFFSLCAIYYCIKLFDRRPGLIVDTQGIVDNSSGVAVGRIPWGEIVGLKVCQYGRSRFLTIVVSNPDDYLGRSAFLPRMLNSMNTRLTGSPINIPSTTLALKFEDLVGILTAAFEKCGKRTTGDEGI